MRKIIITFSIFIVFMVNHGAADYMPLVNNVGEFSLYKVQNTAKGKESGAKQKTSPADKLKDQCESKDGIGHVACNLSSQLIALIPLLKYMAMITGFGFFIASLFKFKQHRDNPSQIPVGTPLAYMLVSIALIYASGLVQILGKSFFPGYRDNVNVVGEGGVPDGDGMLPDPPSVKE